MVDPSFNSFIFFNFFEYKPRGSKCTLAVYVNPKFSDLFCSFKYGMCWKKFASKLPSDNALFGVT